MLDYNEIKPKKFIVLDGAPYEVLATHVFRKQQRKPVNATKLKNLITGGVHEHSFAVSDKVNEAEIETKPARYLYARQNEAWFNEPNNPSQRFVLPAIKIERELKFLKTGAVAVADTPEIFASTVSGFLDGKDPQKNQRIQYMRTYIRPRDIKKLAAEFAADEIESLLAKRHPVS